MTTAEESSPFERFGPADPASPVVIAVPHAGRIYPAALIAAAAVPRRRLEALEDRYADALIGSAIRDGVTAFVARRARAWIDLNRDERELDPGMIEGSALPARMIGSARVRSGLGLIPRRLAGGGEILRRRLNAAEVDARIRMDHRPWHGAIASALAAARARFGIAILLDCHSMPPPARGIPPIVFGDCHGRSAAPWASAEALRIARTAGFVAGLNDPFAGGHIVDRHGAPDSGVHALQIEIDRRLYLNERLDAPGRGFDAIAALIEALAVGLGDALLDRQLATAAE